MKTFIIGTLLICLTALTYPFIFSHYGRNIYSLSFVLTLLICGFIIQLSTFVKEHEQMKEMERRYHDCIEIMKKTP